MKNCLIDYGSVAILLINLLFWQIKELSKAAQKVMQESSS
jgi:hypothetical protein